MWKCMHICTNVRKIGKDVQKCAGCVRWYKGAYKIFLCISYIGRSSRDWPIDFN